MSRIIRAIERRDTPANPSKWLTLAFGGGTDTATGIRVNEVVALRNLTVMSCVNVISQTIAQLPLLVYAKTSDGGRIRIDNHPLYRILDKAPNDRMSAFTLREVLQAHLLTWGNAYAYIEKNNGGDVIGLYPLLPDRTRPQLDANGNLVYLTRIKNDPNGISPADNKEILLLPEEVLHIPGLGFDGLKGYSVVAQARESIGLGLALTEFAARFFGNGAVPGMVFQTDKTLSPEQRTLLGASWAEGHQGLTNASRVAILESGLKVEKIGIPPDDAQFLESRKFSRNELAGIYRVPPHMIGDIERTTSWGTGIEQQAIGFLVYTMLPWFERWQQAINIKLFRRSEQDSMYCEFLPDALLRGDTQTRYAAYNLAFGKWMTGNMIAVRENLPQLGPGGDQLYAPSGMLPLDEQGNPQAPVANAPVDQNEPSALAASAPSFDVRASRQRLAAAHRIAFTDIAERILRRERADLTRALEKKQLTRAAADLFYREHREYVERQATPVLQVYAESVRMLVENELGKPVAAGREFDKFVSAYAEAFAKRYCDESQTLLGDLSPAALEQTFGPSVRRAERIAEHEANRAGNAFARALYRESGVTTYRWLLGDEREDCRAQALANLTESVKFTHPPLGDGCQCVLASAEQRIQRIDRQGDPMIRALEMLAGRQPVINVTSPVPQPSIIVTDREGMAEIAKGANDVKPEDIRALSEATALTVIKSLRELNFGAPQSTPEIHLHIDPGAFVTNVSPPTLTIEKGAIQAPTTIAEGAVRVDMPRSKGKRIVYDKSGKVVGTEEQE